MSDKGSKSVQNKSLNSILRWSLVVLCALVLEAAAIFSAVKITELRGKTEVNNGQKVFDKLSSQQMQINALEKMPTAIAALAQQIDSNTHNINTLAENFDKLNEETGNNKVPYMVEKVADLNHRIEIMEENANGEALILNLALFIKENILYQRPFAKEAELLSEISRNMPELKPYVDILDNYKNQTIKNKYELAQQYENLAQTFIFTSKQAQPEEPEKQSAVAKGVKMLKGTVANLNFDKVVVFKKDKLTEQQKALVVQLNDLVNNYNFKEALNVIAQHQELRTTDENAFVNWQKDVEDMLNAENAISEIVNKQLRSLRQDVENDKVLILVTEEIKDENDDTQVPVSESVETNEPLIEETAND